ncbi:MAG TPA: hypothetical protein PLS94_03490 [Prolixibacteraceae bacterium]|nr:hypothetical protein [Prolixibacteraceae bacterium]HPR59850.1 hypothetical protein [Prolixibacteraceae bacterium]
MTISQKQIEFERQLDISLLRQFKKYGNIELLSEAYDRYVPLVYGLAFNRLQQNKFAQKVVISVFEQLTVAAVQANIDNLRDWIFESTSKCCEKVKLNEHK